MKKQINKGWAIFVAVLCLLVMTFSCCTKLVDNSEIGIKFKKFSLTEQGELIATQVAGVTFYNPITTSVFTYPVYIQRVDYQAFTVTTKDAAVFSMDPLLAYQLDRTRAAYVFNKYRRSLAEIEQGYMRTCIYDAYRICANKYTSDELMGNRARFEQEVRAMLEKSLGDEGFKVSEFTSQITPPQSLSAAIAKAQGEAEATKVKADAEAYYNRTIAASLSPMIVQEDWIEKWDGKLPTVASSGSGMMINLSDIKK